MKEAHFIQAMNNNNYINNLRKNTENLTKENLAYVPKAIPDDSDVRKNINDQINFVRSFITIDQR